LRENGPNKSAKTKLAVTGQRVASRRIDGPAPETLARARWARLLRRLGLPMD
jgi:hypothetical protein